MKISKPFGTWSSDITAKTASKALIEMSAFHAEMRDKSAEKET